MPAGADTSELVAELGREISQKTWAILETKLAEIRDAYRRSPTGGSQGQPHNGATCQTERPDLAHGRTAGRDGVRKPLLDLLGDLGEVVLRIREKEHQTWRAGPQSALESRRHLLRRSVAMCADGEERGVGCLKCQASLTRWTPV